MGFPAGSESATDARASTRRAPSLLCSLVVAILLTATGGPPPVAAQPSPSGGIAPIDLVFDLCSSVSLEELEDITGSPFATALADPMECSYVPDIDSDSVYSIDLRIEGGQVSSLAQVAPGRTMEVAGRSAYWTGLALSTDFADGMFTVQPLMIQPGIDLRSIAVQVAELALPRIGPPLVDATDAFTFEELEATPAACYGDDAWTDAEGHRISGLAVTIGLTGRHVRDASDQPWLIVEAYEYEPTQPTLIGADWPEASWSYAYGRETLVVPGPAVTGPVDLDLHWDVVLRSVMDISYQVRVTAGPSADPRPDEGTLDAIVRAPALAEWERLVSASFC